MRELAGKTAFVTGGASSIGFALGAAFAQASHEAFGNVHVVCNNAGVAAAGGIDNISLDNWRWVLDVNLMGVLHGIRTFLPQIRAHGEGGPLRQHRLDGGDE
jgi:NADP-dependent 3-hydroxy acid dehydrogenase YdfG